MSRKSNHHLNISNWNMEEVGDGREAINIVHICNISDEREIRDVNYTVRTTKVTVMCLKAIMRFRIDRMEIVYHVSAGILSSMFFLEIWWEQRKGYCVCGIKVEGKGSSKPTTATATTTKVQRLLQVSRCMSADTSQWWSSNWDIVIFTLFACISMDFPLRTEWKWDKFDVEAIRGNVVVPMKRAHKIYWRNHIKNGQCSVQSRRKVTCVCASARAK